VVHDDSGRTRSLTLLEAAAELGVGVFASGPLGEGGLLSDQAVKVPPPPPSPPPLTRASLSSHHGPGGCSLAVDTSVGGR